MSQLSSKVTWMLNHFSLPMLLKALRNLLFFSLEIWMTKMLKILLSTRAKYIFPTLKYCHIIGNSVVPVKASKDGNKFWAYCLVWFIISSSRVPPPHRIPSFFFLLIEKKNERYETKMLSLTLSLKNILAYHKLLMQVLSKHLIEWYN